MLLKYWISKHLVTPVRRHIRIKLSLMIIIVAIVPLTMATIISNESARRAMEKEIIDTNLSMLAWISQDYQDNFYRISEAMTAFYFDGDILFYINRINQGGSLRGTGITFLRNKLRSYLLGNYSEFEEVSFYVKDSTLLFSVSSESEFFSQEIDPKIFESDERLQAHAAFIYSEEGIYITKPYLRFEDRKLLGSLVVKLKWQFFEKVNALLGGEENSFILFLDSKGKEVYNPTKHIISNELEQSINLIAHEMTEQSNYKTDTEYYLFYQPINKNLWLLKGVPISVASEFYREQLISQLFLIALAGGIALVFTLYLGKLFSEPILKLTKSMQNLDFSQNQFVIPTSIVRSKDEIKVLEQSYLFMLKKINELIDEEYRQKIETQTAQLMALQAQINPHFMYNTLNMIGAMAIESESKDIYDVVMAFSRMLRYNMRFEREQVTIIDEIDNAKQYLYIQQQRFDQKLEVSYDIPDNLFNHLIPKLCLQPVLENCFKHGFHKREDSWRIHIKIREDDKMIYIHVVDNGQGISTQSLEEINHRLQNMSSNAIPIGDHVGLVNIHSRLKLFYGDDSGLHISSHINKGTEVIINFTKRRSTYD